MEQYLLEMNNISKIYSNGIAANKNVNFNLKKGEIHALVGENGAGKSTLMKILFGMEPPSSGEIILRGEPVRFSSSKDAIAHGIGMVHQHFMLVESFTAAQNIILGMEPKKGLFVSEEEAIRFTKEISKKYNLDVDAEAVTQTLPVGVKQKIEILKALARGAEILILDEPTAVLAPQETDQLPEKTCPEDFSCQTPEADYNSQSGLFSQFLYHHNDLHSLFEPKHLSHMLVLHSELPWLRPV